MRVPQRAAPKRAHEASSCSVWCSSSSSMPCGSAPAGRFARLWATRRSCSNSSLASTGRVWGQLYRMSFIGIALVQSQVQHRGSARRPHRHLRLQVLSSGQGPALPNFRSPSAKMPSRPNTDHNVAKVGDVFEADGCMGPRDPMVSPDPPGRPSPWAL